MQDRGSARNPFRLTLVEQDMATKNLYGKTRGRTEPYAVYRDSRLPGWEWRILKMYQAPEKARLNPYARAFCLVTSPYTGSHGDMGDTYLSDIGREFVSGEDILKGAR